MTQQAKQNPKVLIVTGFSPIRPPQLEEMGMTFESFPILLSMLDKETFRFSLPTIGPVTLGSYLAQHGIKVDIADFFFDDVRFDNYDIVGISSTFLSVEDVVRIAGLARKQNPSATIVLGGPISWSIPPAQVMALIPDVDYIVKQEGEQTFLELIGEIRRGGNPSTINALVFRGEDGNLVETPPRPRLDLDELPLPAWELMGIPSPGRIPVLPIETSRGCPNNCAFCSEVTYWGKPVRYRTINAVVEELRYSAKKLGITTFRFTDSCFSAPPARSGQLCDAIYENCIKNDGIPVKWSAYARIENLDCDLLEKMKLSGCVALDLGLESGSKTVLRKMGRNYSPEAMVEVAKTAKKLGILLNYNVIIGFPGETNETVQATTDIINQAAPDTFSCFLFFLPPNTRVFSTPHYFNIEGAGLDWKHDTMTSEEAKVAMLKMIKQVNQSTHFPGGEHFACYLASLGYKVSEIRDFFQAVGRLAKTPVDDKTSSLVRTMIRSLRNYC